MGKTVGEKRPEEQRTFRKLRRLPCKGKAAGGETRDLQQEEKQPLVKSKNRESPYDNMHIRGQKNGETGWGGNVQKRNF